MCSELSRLRQLKLHKNLKENNCRQSSCKFNVQLLGRVQVLRTLRQSLCSAVTEILG